MAPFTRFEKHRYNIYIYNIIIYYDIILKYGFWDEWLPHENPLHSYKCHLNEYRYVEWCSYVFFLVKMLNKDLGAFLTS